MKKIYDYIASDSRYTFAFFFITSFLTYLYGIDGRFTSDFYNWVNVYDTRPISDLITCYDYPGLHQLYHIPFFLCFKIFHLNKWSWHFVFTLIHATNAFLLYKISTKIFSKINTQTEWALITSTLFLISPFQTETVAWGATIHYLFLVFFSLLSISNLIDYINLKKVKPLILFYTFYILSLFTMELPLVSPGIFVLILLLFEVNFKQILTHFIIPFLVIIALYFMLSKLVFGSLIGHYGADEHLNFDLNLIFDTLYAYLMKFILLFRFIPFDGLKNSLKNLFENGIFQFITFGTLVVFLIWRLLIKHNFDSKLVSVFAFLMMFCIALLPVLNIEMSSNWTMQTDRYSYFASIFFFISLIILFSIIPKKLSSWITAIYVLINFSLMMKEINIWKETGEIAYKMIDSYNFENEKVYTLNIPDNHKGAYLFRNGFVPAVRLNRGINIDEKFNNFLSINTLTTKDRITYSFQNNTLHVEATKWGRWFWKHGRGATNFEDKNFKFTKGLYGASFDLEIKQKNKPNFIYLVGGEWKKVNY